MPMPLSFTTILSAVIVISMSGSKPPPMCNRCSNASYAFCVFGISTSNLPSVSPGIVSLGIGNQFSFLLTSPLTGFDPSTRAATFVVPPMPFPLAYFQAAALDGNSPNPFPLPVTNVRQVQRQ